MQGWKIQKWWYNTVQHATSLVSGLSLPTTHLRSLLAEVLYHLRSKPQVYFSICLWRAATGWDVDVSYIPSTVFCEYESSAPLLLPLLSTELLHPPGRSQKEPELWAPAWHKHLFRIWPPLSAKFSTRLMLLRKPANCIHLSPGEHPEDIWFLENRLPDAATSRASPWSDSHPMLKPPCCWQFLAMKPEAFLGPYLSSWSPPAPHLDFSLLSRLRHHTVQGFEDEAFCLGAKWHRCDVTKRKSDDDSNGRSSRMGRSWYSMLVYGKNHESLWVNYSK